MTSPLSPESRAAREIEYEALQSEHGGYWRHDFVDHAYLYNLHYPPAPLMDALKADFHQHVLNYPVAQDAVAQLVADLIGQPAEYVVVGNGAAELIKIISGHLARKLIVPVPSFNEYVNAAHPGRVVEYHLDAPGFELDVEDFAYQATEANADFAVIVSPNNPTSLRVSRADLVKLLGLLSGHGCRLVVDESFIDFSAHVGTESLEDLVARYPSLAVIKSMSKAYGICGLRIGYLLTSNPDLARRMRDHLHIWNINGFAEAFLRLAPQYRDDFTRSCESVRADRDAFCEDLARVPGLTVYPPEGNYIFCRVPESSPSSPDITRRLFVEDGIYIKHCEGKSMPEGDRYVRIAVRTQAENRALAEALARIVAVA